MLDIFLVNGTKYLHDRSNQECSYNSSDTHSTAQQITCNDKEQITADADGAKLESIQLIGQNDGNQIVGTGSCIGGNYQSHANGQNHTAQYHGEKTYRHGRGSRDKPSQHPVENINDRAAQNAADKRTSLYVPPGKENHKDDQDTLNSAVTQTHRDSCGVGDAGCKNSECIRSQVADQKQSNAQMGNDKSESEKTETKEPFSAVFDRC